MPKRKAVHNSNNNHTNSSSISSSSSSNNNNNSNNYSNSCSMWSSGRSSKKAHRSSSGGDNGRSTSPAAASQARMEQMWSKISDEENNDPNISTMEGFSGLCEELNLDPLEDVRVLVLLWKLKATSKPACITKTEWMTACHDLQCDSIEKFRDLIPSLETGFLDEEEFKDFYKFCFQFNREGTHKTLDRDLVVQLLPLVLSNTNRVSSERIQSFCTFLSLDSQKQSYPRITLDQWTSFWDFSQEVPDDLSEYDESTSAWPVLIDEYVEYMMTKK